MKFIRMLIELYKKSGENAIKKWIGRGRESIFSDAEWLYEHSNTGALEREKHPDSQKT